MESSKSYFFCGIGGSGMLPLACIMRAHGHEVAGSDRALDQGRSPDKFAFLEKQGITLFPQDGSGVTNACQILVTSAAVEPDIADVEAARRIGARHITRPYLLAELFNAAPLGIGCAGTSGKSTMTGMIGWILHQLGRDPTVMNGAVMKNFATPGAPFASALIGNGDIFVSEVDESDGSIALYRPTIAVLGNITLDHKSLDELHRLFGDFVERAKVAILNLDDAETRLLFAQSQPGHAITFSLVGEAADFSAANIVEKPHAIAFDVRIKNSGKLIPVRLRIPGRHNVANALAAIAAATAAGVDSADAAAALSAFKGLGRRFELVGTQNDVQVIDDFAHNPDKIAATLATLHAFPGRLLILFQPHGYGPLKVMKDELIACFARGLADEDMLIMPDPVYLGGTVDRVVGSKDIVLGIEAAGRTAAYVPNRDEAARQIAACARPGDRILVMGARDDTLSKLAADILADL